MKLLLWAIWSIAFVLGLGVMGHRLYDGDSHAVAKRQMPVNHLIQANDLVSGDHSAAFVGRYARRAMPAGLKMSEDDISSVPLLTTGVDPLFAVPVAGATIQKGDVDVGSKGKICNGAIAIGDAEIQALFCRHPDDGRCIALVIGSPGLAAALKPNESEVRTACVKADDSDAKK